MDISMKHIRYIRNSNNDQQIRADIDRGISFLTSLDLKTLI